MTLGEPDRRHPSAAALAVGDALHGAALDVALDCVIAIDDRGRVTYFNPSAERTFGYEAAEALGRELAALIVPPSHRAAHRSGLARYFDSGEESILDRRIELTAMRSDGSEFPVELTVTRTELAGESGFIGFVRDVTERVRTQREQAALRHVATLVAQQAKPDELLTVVAAEVATVLDLGFVSVVRFDPERTATIVGVTGRAYPFEVGQSWPVDETVAARVVWETGEPATVDVASSDTRVAAELLENGLRFATGVPIVVERRLWGAMLALASERDALPEGTVERLQRFTELIATAIANVNAHSQLVAAQRRVIEAGDAARERLTRDIHDGAQQRLVNTLMNLQLGQQKWSTDPHRALELLQLATAEAESAIESLRELAAGIHPAILSDRGLASALDALAARLPFPVQLDVDDLELPAPLAASVYFFCAEALTNVLKHARASSASVRVSVSQGSLCVEVRDDGIGGADLGSGGSGLVGLNDRIAALGGRMALTSPSPGGGTTLTAQIPVTC